MHRMAQLIATPMFSLGAAHLSCRNRGPNTFGILADKDGERWSAESLHFGAEKVRQLAQVLCESGVARWYAAPGDGLSALHGIAAPITADVAGPASTAGLWTRMLAVAAQRAYAMLLLELPLASAEQCDGALPLGDLQAQVRDAEVVAEVRSSRLGKRVYCCFSFAGFP
ncbi:unnamed protein product [Symbiodinium microadriaticum]|nr:unnamed protein product [Symbiodinium microadriaticum]